MAITLTWTVKCRYVPAIATKVGTHKSNVISIRSALFFCAKKLNTKIHFTLL